MDPVQIIINSLGLQPHPLEGGYFRETYRCPESLTRPQGSRSLGTAIYYLLTPETFSALHRLPTDEIFHFYLGDPVRMLQLHPDGSWQWFVLGSEVLAGHHPQLVVPGGVWQGSYLLEGGRFALLGTTMSPGFDAADYEAGNREQLIQTYPKCTDGICRLTRASSVVRD
jgi:predicted cupin superfamily sugar epimerase